MNSILFWLGMLAVLAVAGPALRMLIALVSGDQVALQALAKQPSSIRLSPAAASEWRNAAAADNVVRALAPQGFLDAGGYSIAEMAGVRVRLLAQASESFYAAWYEHPTAGSWLELVTRYQDGAGSSVSTLPPTGLAPLAGHQEVKAPGLSPLALLRRARAERPDRPMRPVSVAAAARDFEQGYAESIEKRRAQGISRGEVVRVAARRAA